VWITDGSLPVFSDTTRLRTSHPVPPGLSTRYEGFVDPAVARGSLELSREQPDDVLFVEAEWYLEFPEGAPGEVSKSTPVLLQGLIEGKWMNRLLGTKAWQPASVGNNVIAAGDGISTTLGGLADTGPQARIAYTSERAGDQVFVARAADLRYHNILALVREVLATVPDVDGIDLGAIGEECAVVNEKRRVRAAARPFPLAHRAKERLVRAALDDGLGIAPGGEATMTVTARGGAVVGTAALRLLG